MEYDLECQLNLMEVVSRERGLCTFVWTEQRYRNIILVDAFAAAKIVETGRTSSIE